ncbi:MAG: NFACT family protein, partial [Pyrinomonadaceae bacterium]
MADDLSKNVTKVEEEKSCFEQQVLAARRKVSNVITKGQKLIENLRGDLQKHGEPERWKRYGDLLLANIHNAERRADSILVTDYFDETAPVIEIEGESNKSINEIAENYFRRYTKARNVQRVIGERMV